MERSHASHSSAIGLALAWSLITLPAALAQTATATFTPTPAALTFNYVTGAALPAAQSLAVKSSSGTPNYTVTIVGTNTLWLVATPESGKMPASLSVRVNPTGMAVGSYTAAIVVSAVGSAASANIGVTLNVTAALPTLGLSTNALAFTSPPLQPAPQTVKLTSTGGPVSYTATVTGAPWMTVSPTSGLVFQAGPAQLTISVDASAVTPQAAALTGKITIVAAGVPAANKTQNITVTLLANPSMPTITSLYPSAAQVNSAATPIFIRGTNFYTASVAKVAGGPAMTTTVISSTVLLATIPAASLTTAGSLNVIVSNPAPGGDSAAVPFAISANPVVQAVTSAASNSGTAVSPGELVTLWGANIGPVGPFGMADADNDGFADTFTNNVTVTIDGVAAPLIYASQNQISVQVPYEVTVGTARAVVVVNGSTTATGLVDIAATAPGLFTLDGSGTGQAAALNFNSTTGLYTFNLSNSPAKVGDIVLLYMTGEGDYATTITPRTGLLVPATLSPLPQVNPLPIVTIGGAAATVQYAGPMVGSVMGLLQLNVTVPAGSTTGTAVPVSVSVGGISSPPGVTLSIHP